MKQNVGTTDKVIRLVVGAAVIAAGVYYQSWWGAIGVVPIATALMNYCPAFAIFGISTRKG